MSNDEMKKFAEVVRSIVKEEIKPVIEKLDTTSARGDAISEKLDANIEETKSISVHLAQLTETVRGEIIPTLNLHTKYFETIAGKFKLQEKQNEKDEENIFRLDKRLSEVEANQSIQPPSELFITK